MRKGTIICFTGIDGSGKTTLARDLVEELQSRGIDAAYVYGRYQPVLLRPVMYLGRLFFFRDKDAFSNYGEYAGSKQQASRDHTVLATLYQRLALWEYTLQLLVQVSLPVAFRRRTLICDRYVMDTVLTDLAVDFQYSEEAIRSTIHRMLDRFPSPDLTFLIDLPEEVALARKTDTPSVEYLRERRHLYLRAAEAIDAVVLDGTRPLDEIRAAVIGHAGGGR
ncbi:dTMP kinase [Methanofollis sp. W23]|uniref:dTMP kinase n=1 Tax=Methanofollis sp. W23 TaxID=2817849 RepID=UPI001AE5282B|nr:adenylyl-sulfate kinase [Methanofollis sp. W23]MBP2144593.1 dTMP kinase [Methanofollis sp. W23]